MFYSDKKCDFQKIEKDCYSFWKSSGYFNPCNYKKSDKNFSIILPPPNITGHLHIGHAYNGTIQDVLIRYHKLNGFNTIWLPGVDHAGIATQTKFDKVIKEQKIIIKSKEDYLKKLQNWTIQQKEFIHQQWAQMGFALSYDNESYTLDENAKLLVNKAFIDLYSKKLIYQDYKLVNWDVKLQTAISDIEVIYRENKAKLYYFKYHFVDDPKNYLTVATSRPETMFGDVCLFVNPRDKRYTKYLNKKVINPINKQIIPIYGDEYIDIKFGTGVMKCTPAHDFHDYDLAIKHKLKDYYSIINEDGTLNNHCVINDKSFEGIDRLVARDSIVEELKKNGDLIKIENYSNQIGISERTGEIIEPLLSKQWFVKMQVIANSLLQKLQRDNRLLTFYPQRFKKELFKWLLNIKDWCISRQLIWGHSLPVYYGKNNDIYVGINPPKGYVQEKGVLDTWFSSGLWPLITTKYNKNQDCSAFYPISYLVTAYDILFFWVARMLFQCNFTDTSIPFNNLLIHGLIRDEHNRKMSKSLNNGIDPVDLIKKYGADTLRMFLMYSSTLGEDIRFSEKKIQFISSFLNKLWNIHNYLTNYKINKAIKEIKHPLNQLMVNLFNNFLKKVNTLFKKNNFAILTQEIINFIWNNYCNIYLELIRPLLVDKEYYDETIYIAINLFKKLIIILNPFVPFITENLYQTIDSHLPSIMEEKWPSTYNFKLNQKQILVMEILIRVVFHIKEFRIRNNIKQSSPININLVNKSLQNKINEAKDFLQRFNINLKEINIKPINKVWETLHDKDLTIEYENNFASKQEQIDLLLKQQVKYLAEVKRSEAILNNQSFLNKAPKQKVEEEKKKYKMYLDILKQINEKLKK